MCVPVITLHAILDQHTTHLFIPTPPTSTSTPPPTSTSTPPPTSTPTQLNRPPVDPSSSPGASLTDSIGNALKLALVGILRTGNAGAWTKKLVGALGALGAGDAADSALRHVARQAKRSRDEGGGNGEGRKRAREGGREGGVTPPMGGGEGGDPRHMAGVVWVCVVGCML